ncbi:protease IV [Fibrella aestuarina BUZ 2]|uniref:Protease IV n=1 Tax=Fibrella aestuarina BUZ 2 TaxID=1166018 RepID=I0KC05_9BACT|nr:S49 family peptidase [Fibrella aestuarina]CCH01658.1 protease IV [Fibrella aestuarina BUZ 2]
MNKRSLDLALIASTPWLIEEAAGAALLAAVLAGPLVVDVPEIPVVYEYQYGYYPAAEHPNSTAIVTFSGPIYADWSIAYTMEQMRRIALDANVTSVVLKLNGPGGNANAGEKFANFLRNYPLPVTAWIDYGMAASAHYMLACACSGGIVASRPTDLVGSIGTYLPWQSIKGYLKKMGIEQVDIYAEQSTEKNQEARAAEAGDFSLLKAYVTQIAAGFIEFVKECRSEALVAVKGKDPFKGAIYQATEALELGLIDAIGPIEDAIARVRSQPNTITTSKTNSMNALGFVRIAALNALAGVAADQVTPEQAATLTEQLNAQGYNIVCLSAQQAADAAALTGQVAALTTQLGEANGRAETLQAEVTRLGQQPGQQPTNPQSAADPAPVSDTSGELTPQQELNALPHQAQLATLNWLNKQ